MAEFERRFHRSLHSSYILSLERAGAAESFEQCATEHLKLSAVYWSVMTMDLIGSLHLMDRSALIAFVLSCFHEESGGFGGNVGHDPHLLYTLSAVQVLLILDADAVLPRSSVISYVASLQQLDGSFHGDRWGETDSRFTYCGLCCLGLVGGLWAVDVKLAVEWVCGCRCLDGGFGAVPGAESHSGQIWCCVAALCLGDGVGRVDEGVLGWWLAERQLPGGGLNGRPEKKPDVCYSYWVLASLHCIGRPHFIDGQALVDFVLSSQDQEEGGLADRPGNTADPFHTFFGIAALSMLGCRPLQEIDPVYAMPVRVIQRLGIGKKLLHDYRQEH